LHKYIAVFFTSILLVVLFVTSAQTTAAESVNIKVTLEEGFDGKVKRGEGFPLTIHLENGGESFSGDLLIHYNPSYNAGGAVSVHVELPKGGSKTYQVSVPGLTEESYSNNQKRESVHLYKGNWKQGNKVSFLGDTTMKPRFINPVDRVIGVLSENYDRIKELRMLPSSSVQMLPLTKEQLPKQSLGLEMIDYIIIDEYAVSQLDEQQQVAIKEWISAGGVLIAGAAPDASESYGLLYPLLPMKWEVESSGTTEFLRTARNDQIDFKEINLFTGPVEKDAQVLQRSGSLPASLKKPFGNGTILQTSFSLGDQPLSEWKGYSIWFKHFLNEADSHNTISAPFGHDFYERLYWEFVEMNELFPASHYSVAQLIIMLVIYLIIMVPVLYFVLRKLDKREHSWWIIPSLSIVMTVIVFGLGAKDRISEPQLNQMGVYQVKNQQLVGIQATTLLSNRSGEYQMRIPKGQFSAIPHVSNSARVNPFMGAVTLDQRNEMKIVFPDVGYWSSKTIYGKAQKEANSDFIVNLSVKNSHLTGTIENRFPYDFEELFIWSGNVKINVGSLKAGETLKVNQKINQSFLPGPSMLSNAGMYPPNQQSDLEKRKIERLQYAASIFLNMGNQSSNNKPLLGGITKEAIIKVDLEGKEEKQNNLNLILSPFVAKSDFSGEFTLTNEMLSTQLEVVSGIIHEKGVNGASNEMMMEDGEYDYIIQLPEPLKGKKVELKSINLRLNGQFVQYSVLNRVTGEYLEIKQNQTNITINKENNVEQYFSEAGELLIKVHKNTKGDPYVYLPTITVKGDVKP
jgi:hypothetical protein